MVEPLVALGAAAVAMAVGGAGGFITGKNRENRSQSSAERDGFTAPAQRLDCPPQPAALDDAVATIVEALDAVIDSAELTKRGVVSPTDGPIQRAESVRRIAEHGNLCTDNQTETPGPEHPDGEDAQDQPTSTQTETPPEPLAGAVDSVRVRTDAKTTTGQRLLDYLESVDEVSEPKMVETLDSVIESLNHHDAVTDALTAAKAGVETDELAQTLEHRSDSVGKEAGEALSIIATRFRETTQALERCRSERDRLLESGDQICAAARKQTTLSFDDEGNMTARLETLSDRLDDGTVLFASSETNIGRIATQLSPESELGHEFVDILTSGTVDQKESERTLQSVVTAIDRAETTSHRLEGIDPAQVEQQASRLVERFKSVDTPASTALRERAANLERMVAEAGSADLITVYAARQELRFYDRKLLPQLQTGGEETSKREDIAALADEVERRRSHMRTDYPSDYPDHDHSIPIHFLELVSTLQESADEARTNGNDGRALGYLKAADQTLDWVEELYERHAYSVLLEQLRG